MKKTDGIIGEIIGYILFVACILIPLLAFSVLSVYMTVVIIKEGLF